MWPTSASRCSCSGSGVVVDALSRGGLGDVVADLLPAGDTLPELLLLALVATALANLVNNLPATLLLAPLRAARHRRRASHPGRAQRRVVPDLDRFPGQPALAADSHPGRRTRVRASGSTQSPLSPYRPLSPWLSLPSGPPGVSCSDQLAEPAHNGRRQDRRPGTDGDARATADLGADGDVRPTICDGSSGLTPTICDCSSVSHPPRRLTSSHTHPRRRAARSHTHHLRRLTRPHPPSATGQRARSYHLRRVGLRGSVLGHVREPRPGRPRRRPPRSPTATWRSSWSG